MTLPTDIKDREMQKFVEDDSGNVSVRSNLVVKDIEIGAVEIKDGTTDTRAKVKTDGTDNAMVTVENPITAFDHGAKSGISTSAVQITGSSIPTKRGVVIKAANTNTGTIYVGNSDVTGTAADATDGFELGGGESIMIEVSNANLIYVVASIAAQRVSWVVV